MGKFFLKSYAAFTDFGGAKMQKKCHIGMFLVVEFVLVNSIQYLVPYIRYWCSTRDFEPLTIQIHRKLAEL